MSNAEIPIRLHVVRSGASFNEAVKKIQNIESTVIKGSPNEKPVLSNGTAQLKVVLLQFLEPVG